MVRKGCPQCKRDTWSEKWESCSACGHKITLVTDGPKFIPVSPHPDPDRITPVTPNPVLSNIVTPIPELTDRKITFVTEPGETCVACGEKKPSKNALRQRKYREGKKNG